MNTIINIPKNITLSIIPDLHSSLDQWNKFVEIYKPGPTRWVCSLGDVCDRAPDGEDPFFAFNSITDDLRRLAASQTGFAVKGNHETRLLKKTKHSGSSEFLEWWKGAPLSINFQFHNGNQITCVHAGLPLNPTVWDLEKNIELLYIRDLDENGKMIPLIWVEKDGEKQLIPKKPGGRPWGEFYKGEFGMVYFGHVVNYDSKIKIYNFARGIDGGCYCTGKLCVQVINDKGNLIDNLIIDGKINHPELLNKY